MMLYLGLKYLYHLLHRYLVLSIIRIIIDGKTTQLSVKNTLRHMIVILVKLQR